MKNRILQSFAFRVVSPVLIAGLLASAGFYVLVRSLLDRFAEAGISDELGRATRDVYGLCETADKDLVRAGPEGHAARARIRQARTLAAIEDLLRGAELAGLVMDQVTGKTLCSLAVPASPAHLLARAPTDHSIAVASFDSVRYALVRFSFEPWHWQLVVTKDLRDFEQLFQGLRSVHLGATGLMGIGALVLGAALGRFVRGPLQAVIDPIREGRPPAVQSGSVGSRGRVLAAVSLIEQTSRRHHGNLCSGRCTLERP
jgi:hypothetical protein